MKFCYNTNFTLPKQTQRSRSILQDGSRSLGLFWKEKTLSYNRRNTVYYFFFFFDLLNCASSCRKEFARGTNSFLQEWTCSEELQPPEKQTGISDGKHRGWQVNTLYYYCYYILLLEKGQEAFIMINMIYTRTLNQN